MMKVGKNCGKCDSHYKTKDNLKQHNKYKHGAMKAMPSHNVTKPYKGRVQKKK